MMFQRRIDYRFNGYEAPAIPRATRSTRRRAKFQRRVEDDQTCAIDLLATVAGKLFPQDKENPTMPGDTSTEKDQSEFVKECQDANKPLEAELFDEGSYDKKCFPYLSSQTNNQNCSLKEFPHPEIDVHPGIASVVITSSSCSERFVAEKLVDGNSHNKMENFTNKDKLDSSGYLEVSCYKLDGHTSKVRDELPKLEKVPNAPGIEMCSFEDPLAEKPPALISLGGNAKLSWYDNRVPCSSLSKGCDNVPVISRDDDENYSGCTHPCTKTKSFRPRTCIDNKRIRKLLACKYRKVAQEPKDDTLCNSDGDLKPTYHSKKDCYKRQRSQMNIPFKKRKPFNCSSILNSNGFIRSGDMYYSHENGMNQDASGSSPRMREDPGMPSLEGQHSTLRCRGDHVNLRIKSFRVPEIFIEIPETATIGSLKRTVMDAVTAVLGDGLRVGVILQGKKVRDDSKTLLQTGISHDNQLDALGFTLEPNFSQSLPPLCASRSPGVPRADVPAPLIRYPSSPAVTNQSIQGGPDMLPGHLVTSLGNLVESDNDSAPSPINASLNKSMRDSKALVTVPEMSKEEAAVVPVVQKSKRSESLLRRIRRPFSVDEVEALVQAVEKLGTGRWRDVKRHAFDNANHRTYVDLKDKWKTLVHTARISPQQRRGEAVPQELLDRVLTAHAYWSQRHTKQQHKHPETSLLFNQGLSTARGYVDGVTA